MTDLILRDPDNCAGSPERFHKLEKKISSTRTRLVRSPQRGGNPFLFSLTATKPHELCFETPDNFKVKAAATNGKVFYWNPDYLERITSDEAAVVMLHEALHIILHHNSRVLKFDHDIWRIAIDYIVNGIIWKEHNKVCPEKKLWTRNIGPPLSLIEFTKYLDGDIDLIPGIAYRYADITTYERTSESIYKEILKHWEDSPRRCSRCNKLSINPRTKKPLIQPPYSLTACQSCGSGGEDPFLMDTHVPIKSDKNLLSYDLSRAIRDAEKLNKGSVPSYIDDKVEDLGLPVINFIDIIRSMCMNIAQRDGMKNDWKRPRRRLLSTGYYLPQRHEHKPTWLALLDTSASMSARDISFGLTQLKTLTNDTEGHIVPCDARVYWDKATKISNEYDLSNVKIAGRGGTVFDSFFKEFPKKLGDNFDLIIIITDGFCGEIPAELKPKQEVVWVITSATHFKSTFGKVVQLKQRLF